MIVVGSGRPTTPPSGSSTGPPSAGTGGTDVVEARLVDELREDAGFLPHLSLVAEDDGRLVGHVIATRGWLEPLGVPVLGLGPLGVHPDAQGRGVGTALVHALRRRRGGLRRAARRAARRTRLLPGASASSGRPSSASSRPTPRGASTSRRGELDGPPLTGTFRYAEPFNRL